MIPIQMTLTIINIEEGKWDIHTIKSHMTTNIDFQIIPDTIY